jgi:hypothetical protein
VKLSDRIKRWWAPARWRDEHPEISDGDGSSLSTDERLDDVVARPGGVPNWAGNGGGSAGHSEPSSRSSSMRSSRS